MQQEKKRKTTEKHTTEAKFEIKINNENSQL